MSEGYDRNKDVQLFKEGINVNKEKGARFLNVIAYQYDGGEPKVRIQVANKNTNPNAPTEKQWINQKGISQLTKPEVDGLINALQKAKSKL